MSLAEAVRRFRGQRYLSQAELATSAGLSRTTIARIESGEIVPYPRTVRKLAEALGVKPTELATPDELQRSKRAASTSQAARQLAANGPRPSYSHCTRLYSRRARHAPSVDALRDESHTS
jgi:transcriptional regulator with XRE-family HTH domain